MKVPKQTKKSAFNLSKKRKEMIFAPKPKNEFNEFMMMYYEQCRSKIPQIEALAAKWNFEDLIPGMSDYDTRFIYSEMTVDDWCNASMSIGDVHLDICSKYPKWARILEHLPGINLTWDEFTDDNLYYPEYHQWTIYHSHNESKLESAQEYLADHQWDSRDEYFFLKKFLTYYGPYDRKIDPAVNLKEFENKYPLHSRFMHYFVPPLQAAVCVIQKRPIRGKMESVLEAKKIFPKLAVLDELIEAVEKHYEFEHLYFEPDISELEKKLYDALTEISKYLGKHITIFDKVSDTTPIEWKKLLKTYKVNPLLNVFDNAKWSRQMKGRLYFYANAPKHFDSQWCIEIELNRIHNMFFAVPYKTYWELTTGQTATDLVDIVKNLTGTVLTAKQADSTLKYHYLTSRKWDQADYKKPALEIVEIYEDFYRGLYNLTEILKKKV